MQKRNIKSKSKMNSLDRMNGGLISPCRLYSFASYFLPLPFLVPALQLTSPRIRYNDVSFFHYVILLEIFSLLPAPATAAAFSTEKHLFYNKAHKSLGQIKICGQQQRDGRGENLEIKKL